MEGALSPLKNSSIRIISYIDSYLICSHLREQAVRDSAREINHLRDLEFRKNLVEVEPVQCTEYLGININSLSHAIGGEISLSHTVSLPLPEEESHMVQTIPSLLGLMASVISVVHLGLLMMSNFQRWVAALRLCPRRHLGRKVKITPACVVALPIRMDLLSQACGEINHPHLDSIELWPWPVRGGTRTPLAGLRRSLTPFRVQGPPSLVLFTVVSWSRQGDSP